MPITIREAHQWAFSFLHEGGQRPEEARFAAERLLRHFLGLDRAQFFVKQQDPLPSDVWIAYKRVIEQKRVGIPLQHLIGTQEFYGRAFRVSREVLIPRPETEILVEEVLRQADASWGSEACSVVDVGTGSGAIAVTLAAERPSWQVTAVDLSRSALRIARENAGRHGVEGRIRFLPGDLLAPLIERRERVDMVVSNPPYIPSSEIPTLAPEVRDHEPKLALDGGADGLDVYRHIMIQLPYVTREQRGLIAMEVGIGQSEQVAQWLHRTFPKSECRIVPDLAGIERVVLAVWT